MIYSIVMNRWGDETKHSYTLGICVDKVIGEVYGHYHGKCDRGGKYDVNLIPFDISIEGKSELLQLCIFDDDRNNLRIFIVDNKKDCIPYLIEESGTFFELEAAHVWTSLPKTVIKDCLECLYLFNEEQKQYIKDEYEKILRKENG